MSNARTRGGLWDILGYHIVFCTKHQLSRKNLAAGNNDVSCGPLEDRTIDKSGILALSKTVLQAHTFWNQQFAREEGDRDGESKRERGREGGRSVSERESVANTANS